MSQLMICNRCRERPAVVDCQVCLDLGDVTKLCQDCFGPHYRLMHKIATNPEEEKLLRAELSVVKDPTFEEMHPSVAKRDMDSHPHLIGIVKNNKKRKGKSRREADMEAIQAYILEKLKR